MLAVVCRFILNLLGWRVQLPPSEPQQFVLIGYPHTSNMDFFLAMLAKGAVGLQFHFIAKDSLFWWPLGVAMRALGGIPVDRTTRRGVIAELAARFQRAKTQQQPFVLAMMPEGTRSYRPHWRSGFYYLAREADVPVLPGYLDYQTRTIGFAPMIKISGNLQLDLAHLKAAYAGVYGRYHDKSGPVGFKDKAD